MQIWLKFCYFVGKSCLALWEIFLKTGATDTNTPVAAILTTTPHLVACCIILKKLWRNCFQMEFFHEFKWKGKNFVHCARVQRAACSRLHFAICALFADDNRFPGNESPGHLFLSLLLISNTATQNWAAMHGEKNYSEKVVKISICVLIVPHTFCSCRPRQL